MTEKESRIVLHVPHSSRRIPSEYVASYLIEDMDAEHIKMTDMYCDELFCDGRTAVVFPYSRLLCDVERFRDDAAEEMSAVGMGTVSSVMIEINRRLYMNENGEKTAGFAELKSLILGLYSLLE